MYPCSPCVHRRSPCVHHCSPRVHHCSPCIPGWSRTATDSPAYPIWHRPSCLVLECPEPQVGCTGQVPVLCILGCPRRSQDIPLGWTGHKVPVLSVLRCPGRSRDIPLGCAGHKVPVLSVLRCPGRSQDIPLGCTGHKVPVLSVLGCPGRSQCHPAWLHREKSQSYVSWDVPGDPGTSRLAAPGTKSQS